MIPMNPNPYDAEAIVKHAASIARRERAKRGHITQVQAGNLLKIHQRTLSKFERAEYNHEFLAAAFTIAKGYGIDPIAMLFGEHTITVQAMTVARAFVKADKATQQAVLDLLHLTSTIV